MSVDIAAGASRTPTSVAAGGVALDPPSAGGADISVPATGFAAFPTSDTQGVTVTP